MVFHIIVCFIFFLIFQFLFFLSFFNSFHFLKILSIVYLNREIRFTNIFCLFFLVASCVL